jgi:hypothetical protein
MEANLPMTEPGVIGNIWSIWPNQRTAMLARDDWRVTVVGWTGRARVG